MSLLHQLTEILKVDPDLMHSACEGPAEHHAGAAVETHPLKLRPGKRKENIKSLF